MKITLFCEHLTQSLDPSILALASHPPPNGITYTLRPALEFPQNLPLVIDGPIDQYSHRQRANEKKRQTFGLFIFWIIIIFYRCRPTFISVLMVIVYTFNTKYVNLKVGTKFSGDVQCTVYMYSVKSSKALNVKYYLKNFFDER